PAAGIAAGAAPASELLEIGADHRGLLLQLAHRAGCEIIVAGHVHETAGQSPKARKRLAPAPGPLHQQNMQGTVPDREDDDIDRRQGPWKVQHFRPPGLTCPSSRRSEFSGLTIADLVVLCNLLSCPDQLTNLYGSRSPLCSAFASSRPS